MSEKTTLNAIILAGGKSSRMGTDKGLVLLEGKTMVEHVIAQLKKVTDNILIISSRPEYKQFGYPCYEDVYQEKGALGGIYTGLMNSTAEKNLIVGCDMPFLSEDLLKSLLSNVNGEDAVVTEHKGQPEPLCAIYNKTCIPHFKSSIENNNLKITDALKGLKTSYISFDKEPWIKGNEFVNINSSDELTRIENNKAKPAAKIFPSDIEISQSASIRHIKDVAKGLGISNDDLEYYGKTKAKLPLKLINEEKIRKSKLILVSAISPTPAGEGKTTTSVGLADGLNKIGKKAMPVIREPSLGPLFGMKGGAAGGGYAQVIPMEEINLHFTGDFNAVEKANNLLAALIDNNIQSKTRNLDIDPRTVLWKRVMDMNDRALRNILIGLGGTANGVPRPDGFNITAASEVMAILCMSKDLEDLKRRLGNILVGFTRNNEPVFARQLNAQGAMAILLREAIKPNLVQTLEGNPALIHGGPFANIAQGTNTIIATKMGLSLSDYVVTEAGFGADLGAEKFMDIKCGYAGLAPHAMVLVATIRALRYHGGAKKAEFNLPNIERVKKGFENLAKHIENCQKFGLKPIVSINHFYTDSQEEIDFVIKETAKLGIKTVVSEAWEKGGDGAKELARAVIENIESGENNFKPLYDWSIPVDEKIWKIATEIYGADGVEYSPKAKEGLKKIKDLGFDNLPVCMAKTQKSFSDDETKIGRPRNFTIMVREFEFAAGAGFVIPILGDMMRMPGLPVTPASEGMDIDNEGKISGLS